MLRWLTVACLVTWASITETAAAASLAELVADKLRKALPGYSVVIVDPTTLRIGKPRQAEKDQETIFLDRVHDYCQRLPAHCNDEIATFAKRAASFEDIDQNNVDIKNLRAVIRPDEYTRSINQMFKGRNDEAVSKSYAPGLSLMCYFDAPTAMRVASKSDLTKLGVSEDVAFDLCVANTRKTLPLPDAAKISGANSVSVFSGDAYDSSLLSLHDDWGRIVKTLRAPVLVAVPGADAFLATKDQGPQSVDAMSTLAKKFAGMSERPISTAVFRWTPGGWEVAAP